MKYYFFAGVCYYCCMVGISCIFIR